LYLTLLINMNTKIHVSKVDGFSQKRGVSGGHNSDAFDSAVTDKQLKVVNSTEHPSITGISHVKYQIPSKDAAGNITGYKNKIYEKTVYDPKVFSDSKILELGQQAAAKGYTNAISKGASQFSSEVGGVKFRVYIKDGVVDNFHPEF